MGQPDRGRQVRQHAVDPADLLPGRQVVTAGGLQPYRMRGLHTGIAGTSTRQNAWRTPPGTAPWDPVPMVRTTVGSAPPTARAGGTR